VQRGTRAIRLAAALFFLSPGTSTWVFSATRTGALHLSIPVVPATVLLTAAMLLVPLERISRFTTSIGSPNRGAYFTKELPSCSSAATL